MNRILLFIVISFLVIQCSKKIENTKIAKTEIAKSSQDLSLDDSLLGFYSNVEVDTEETGDCSGYTIGFSIDSANKLSTSFVAHEGNCNILGFKMDSIIYSKSNSSISFLVPVGLGQDKYYYKFHGILTKSLIEGKLTIIYPDHSNNITQELKLPKRDADFSTKFKPNDASPEGY